MYLTLLPTLRDGPSGGAWAPGPIKKKTPLEEIFFYRLYIYILISNKNSISHEERVNKTSTRCS